MPSFALVMAGVIVDLSPTVFDVPPSMTWTSDASTVIPAPQVGWTATEAAGAWTFTAPAAPALTLSQQATQLLAAGVEISSTSTPAIDAVYPCDQSAVMKILAEMSSIMKFGTFTNGGTTMQVKTISGAAWPTLSIAQYEAMAAFAGSYAGACQLVIDGAPGAALPATNAQTIA